MAYTDDFVKRVVRATDIVDLIGRSVKLSKVGDDYIGLCPFEKNPYESFVVYVQNQVYKCFECGESGNSLTFLMSSKGMSIDEAVEYLAKNAGIKPHQKDITEEKEPISKSQLYAVYEAACSFYHKSIFGDDDVGLKYIQSRGLTDETIESWKIGFAPDSGNSLYAHLTKNGFSDDIILAAGLARLCKNNKPYDYFRGRVMFPICDAENRVVAFSGRVLDDGKPKYLNSPESDIFNKSKTLFALNRAKESSASYFLMCEGQMDAISLHQAGFNSAIAPLGTAFTKLHVDEIETYKKNVVLAFDADAAGQKAAAKVVRIANRSNLKFAVIDLSPCKDPDEYIKTYDVQSFKDRLHRAKSPVDCLIKSTMAKYNVLNPEEKDAGIKELVSVLTTQSLERLKDYDLDENILEYLPNYA